jgi:hypothetical protein
VGRLLGCKRLIPGIRHIEFRARGCGSALEGSGATQFILATQMEKIRSLKLKWPDVPAVSDVLCIIEPRGGGAVTVLANEQGRDCLQKVFPEWSIPWEANSSGFPRDWLYAVFHVPELARGAHNLPQFADKVPLDEAAPAQLLAVAAKNQGARAMTWDEQRKPQFELFIPSRAA